MTPDGASGGNAGHGLPFLRLLQISSPTFPIGGFAYSQGLEAAVTARVVIDERTARDWLLGLLAHALATLDLAVFARVHRALAIGDVVAAQRWDAFLLASRATAELQTEDRHLGRAMARARRTLSGEGALGTDGQWMPESFASAFAAATVRFSVELRPALEAFAFNWAEAQTSAAVRLVPLGQGAGMRILAAAGEAIPAAADKALALSDDEVGATAPHHALLSIAHETQYSRLFRS